MRRRKKRKKRYRPLRGIDGHESSDEFESAVGHIFPHRIDEIISTILEEEKGGEMRR